MDHFWHFYLSFVYSKCKRSSLRSQCWMRLFLWFSNTVQKILSQSDLVFSLPGHGLYFAWRRPDFHAYLRPRHFSRISILWGVWHPRGVSRGCAGYGNDWQCPGGIFRHWICCKIFFSAKNAFLSKGFAVYLLLKTCAVESYTNNIRLAFPSVLFWVYAFFVRLEISVPPFLLRGQTITQRILHLQRGTAVHSRAAPR